MNSREARQEIVEALRLDLIGPDNDHECAHELLPESPYRWYLSGYLVPADAPDEIRFDESSREGIADAAVPEDPSPGVAEGSDTAEPPSSSKSYLPSSIGLSLLIPPEAEKVTVKIRWGDYHAEAPEEEAREAEGDEEHGYAPAKPAKKLKGFRRECREESSELDFSEFDGELPKSYSIANSGGLGVTATLRRMKNCAPLGLPNNTIALSVFLVNYRKADQKNPYKACVFQAELEVESSLALLNQPDLRGLSNRENQDWDERLADLQYRNIQDFGVGHGVATQSTIDAQGTCFSARTQWLPQHEVEHVVPSLIDDVEFGMFALANCEHPADLGPLLQPLVEQYRQWIAQQEDTLSELSDDRRKTAITALTEAKCAADRIERGIVSITSQHEAFTAFQIANRAMARSAARRLGIDEPEWRPFQLAFILLNIGGIIDQTSPEREIVDLLFFPTGGGKTEAYLGLAAFTIVLRRLRNPGINYAGLSVLMRYTLRLLTLDQLSRAAGLMCALELEREKNEALGAWPFEIGLWVG